MGYGWRQQVFLNATTSKKQAMHTRLRSVELWMKRKDLPRSYRHRVRQYERQRWAATRGVDECRIVRDLPEGLRRDIKYHLCLGLVRQVRAPCRGVTSRSARN
jgi:cyclic nucleotide gated channel, plant